VGRGHGCLHRCRGDWKRSRGVNRRSGRSGSWRFNRQNCPGKSSCGIWPAARGRLSLCAMVGNTRVFPQPLHRSRLRSPRRAARWTYSRSRYGSPFPQAIVHTTKRSGASNVFSALAIAACQPAPALRRSCLIIPATVGGSFRPVICASRQIPCENRCSVHSVRDRASRLDF
jgi:hypothetical protein